jgi:hypothetical protein
VDTLNSALVHWIARPCSSVAVIPVRRHARGDMRYMKIQKLGRACSGCMTPLKVRVAMKSRVAMCATGFSTWHAAATRDEDVELYDDE